MELVRLIETLSKPESYPHPVDAVDVRQTHISVVFLAGAFAYKLKKPVNLGFLDFTTLEKRRHFCEEEVRLNRRLAKSVYLGVVPITADGHIEGNGETVDWAVKMERLPEGTSLLDRLKRGEVDEPLVDSLAVRVAGFHAAAERGSRIAEFGRFDVVAGNARENFDSGRADDRPDREPIRVRAASRKDRGDARTAPATDRVAGRARSAVRHARRPPPGPRLSLPRPHAPDDLIVIDCIEFNERFRFADPVADAAFLVMDLIFRGRRDLADRFRRRVFPGDRRYRRRRTASLLHRLSSDGPRQGRGISTGREGDPGGGTDRGAPASTSAMVAGPGRTRSTDQTAGAGALGRPAGLGQIDPGPLAGRTRRIHGDPLGRRA